MSLSKVFKGKGSFQPTELVARRQADAPNWQAQPVAERDRQQPPASKTEQVPTPPEPVGGHPPVAPEDVPATDNMPPKDAGAPADEQASEVGEQPVVPAEPPPDLEAIRAAAYDAGREQGLREGREEGRKQGRKDAEADFSTTLKSLQQVCEQLSSVRETILKNSRGELIELVFALAEKILRFSVREQDRTILATVEEALSQAVRSNEFIVYLHPDDLAVVREREPELITNLNGIDHLAIKSDSSVEQGGCRIESDTCTVDATIVSQLEIIHERLREAG